LDGGPTFFFSDLTVLLLGEVSHRVTAELTVPNCNLCIFIERVYVFVYSYCSSIYS